jgi:hypothetical protein
MIFSLFLDPRFVNLKHLLDLYSHGFRYYKIAHSKPYILQMKDKLLDYIVAAEHAANHISESTCGEGVHLHEIKDLYGVTTTSNSESTHG